MRRSRSSTQLSRRSSASRSKDTQQSTSTKSSGPYSRNFHQHLVDHAVYPAHYRFPDGTLPSKPANWDEIQQRLRQPRPSLSPSRFTHEDFETFVQADGDTAKESQVLSSVIPIIEGIVKDGKCAAGGIPFTNLDHLTDGTLVSGNPDRYYGARPEQLHPQIREELSGHTIPSTQKDLPVAPNFFLAVKGPDGSLAVAGRQACYDGSLGARGMSSLQARGQHGESDLTPDYGAHTVTSIYHGGTLKMYTVHQQQSATSVPQSEYFMHQVGSWSITGDKDAFCAGAAAYRNARDWTQEERDRLIRLANMKVSAPPGSAASQQVDREEVASSGDTVRLSQYARAPETCGTETSVHSEDVLGAGLPRRVSIDVSVEVAERPDQSRGETWSQKSSNHDGRASSYVSPSSERQDAQPLGPLHSFSMSRLDLQPIVDVTSHGTGNASAKKRKRRAGQERV